MMCDLTIAADNAVFGQTGPKVGSFDAGYGSTQMVRLIGAGSATACPAFTTWQLWRLNSHLEDGRQSLVWAHLHLPQHGAAPNVLGSRGFCPCAVPEKWLCTAGQKRAREMWFLARLYDAQQALKMGLVNTVVPLAQLEEETTVW